MSEVRKHVAKTFLWGILNEILSKLSPLLLTMLAARNLQLTTYSSNQSTLWNLDLIYFLIAAGFYDFFSTKIASEKSEVFPKLIPKMLGYVLILRTILASLCLAFFWGFLSHYVLVSEGGTSIDWLKVAALGLGLLASILDVSFVFVAQNRLSVLFKNITAIRVLILVFAFMWIRGPEDGSIFLAISLLLNFLIAINSFILSFKEYGVDFKIPYYLFKEFLGQWVYFPRLWFLIVLERIEFYLAYFFLDPSLANALVPSLRFSQMISPFLLLGIGVLYSDLIARNLHQKRESKKAISQSVYYSTLWILLLSVPCLLVMLILKSKPLIWIFGDSNLPFFENLSSEYVPSVIFLGIVLVHLSTNLSQQILVSLDRRRDLLIWIAGCISIAAIFSILSLYVFGEVGVLNVVWLGLMIKGSIFIWSYFITKKVVEKM